MPINVSTILQSFLVSPSGGQANYVPLFDSATSMTISSIFEDINDININKRINLQSNYSIKEYVIGNASGDVTINLTSGNYVTATSIANTSWYVSGVQSSGGVGFILQLTNGGAYTQTWPSGSKWPGGTAPTLTASGIDVITFVTNNAGTTWRAVASMVDSK